jgi:predicted dehydrogenase
MLQASNESDFLLMPFERPEQTDRDRLGYAFVGGIHSLAVAVHLMGPVVQVSAYANTSDANTPEGLVYDSDMAIACRFASGAIGSLHFTGRSSQPRHGIRHFRVFGSRGRLDFDVFAGRVELLADGLRTVFEDFFPAAGHAETINSFVCAIRGGDSPPTSIQSQLEVLRVLYAAYRSARESGRAVSLSEF